MYFSINYFAIFDEILRATRVIEGFDENLNDIAWIYDVWGWVYWEVDLKEKEVFAKNSF